MFDKIKQLGSHVVIYGFGNAGTRVVGFLLIPVYSRYLTPEDYGVLALVTMFAQVLYTFMNMGQSSALFRTYFRHDDAESRQTVITTSLWLILVLSFPIGLLALILSKPLSSLLAGTPEYAVWVALGIGGVAFKTLLRLPQAIMRAREESRRYAKLTVAQTLVALVLAVVFVVGLHLGGRGVLMSQLIAEVLICLYLVPEMVRGLSLRFSKRDARELLGYGWALVPGALLSFVTHLSDRYFLKMFVSVSAVGIYALGYRIGEILYLVLLAFELAYPQFVYSHLKNPDAKTIYSRVCTYYLAGLGFIWLAVSLFAEETVKIMAAPAYHDAYLVVPWIAGAFLFQGLGTVWNISMFVHRIVKYRLMSSITTATISVILNVVLIPRYGMMGAAMAALATFFCQFLIQARLGYHLFPIPHEWGRIARLVAVGAAVYAAGSLITWGPIPAALAGKSLLLLAAPLLLYATGFFEHGETARIKALAAGFRRASGTPAALRGGK
jgi:O-antigen/teichoic acid export membrane protein